MKREILFVLLAAYSASAVTDLRPQTEADGPAKTEADPKLNVHIVFSNHLDVGFDKNGMGGRDDQIIDFNFNEHFAAAIKCADELRERGGTERMKYMTHSFLVSLYLDCPPNLGIDCPDDSAKEAFKKAVQQGDIWWHAMPHNAELEFMDKSMLQANIQLTHELDKAFGLPPKITMSQRDVPGFTRAAVPVLVGQGIKAVTVGVNGGSAPPDVPYNTPFLWHDKQSKTEIVAMWHPGGYSGAPVDHGTDPLDGCVITKGFDHVLCAAWNLGDNSGPQNSTGVLHIFDIVRSYFPGANVFASTFDAYTEQLLAKKSQLDLPVVYGEIGDTWIYGVQSDADKVAEFRAFMRMRRSMASELGAYMMKNFTRMMIKVPEHTWGEDVKVYLNDYDSWSNGLFGDARSMANYRHIEVAWMRQRSYTRWALEALEEGSSARLKFFGVLEELASLKRVPQLDKLGFTQLGKDDNLTFSSHAWTVAIDPTSGGLVSLTRKWADGRQGAQWATQDTPLGRLMYSTYTEADYGVIWDQYQYVSKDADWWFRKDFGKANLDNSVATNRSDTFATVQGMWAKQDSEDSFEVISLVTLPEALVTDVGAPAQMWQWFKSPAADDRLFYDVRWVNKTATRLPEAMWVQFAPDSAVADSDTWALSKLGSLVSPLDVLRNGSHSMHGVDDDGVAVNGLGYRHSWERLRIRTLDTALVSPGEPNPFPNVKVKPDMSKGVSFCLANNIWGTNYVMWQPYTGESPNMGFRFELEMLDTSPVAPYEPGIASQSR